MCEMWMQELNRLAPLSAVASPQLNNTCVAEISSSILQFFEYGIAIKLSASL